ncbi:MAG: GyrI-like domain-containing protein [Candidatus Paceibacterota bacterium]|jgi:AraC family transcriptional regulator
MEYKQIEMGSMKMVGVAVNTSTQNAPQDCMPTWMEFMKRFAEVTNSVNPQIMYGVSFVTNKENCTFRYLAGVEVSEFGEVKEGLEQVEVPASIYLVFTHKGKLDTLGQTYGEIMYQVKSLGKEQKEFWIEYYDERYKNNSDDSEFDIWIAVE